MGGASPHGKPDRRDQDGVHGRRMGRNAPGMRALHGPPIGAGAGRGAGRFPTSRRATHTVGRTQGNGGPMARIEETFDDRDWYMIECDDPDCETTVRRRPMVCGRGRSADRREGRRLADPVQGRASRIGTRHALLPGAPAARMLDLHEHHDRSGRLEGRAMPRMHQGGDPE